MSRLFHKLGQATSLFSKSINDGKLFSKANEYMRKGDNSVARVGNFLYNTANSVGLTPLAGMIKTGMDTVHTARLAGTGVVNNLERSIKAPMNEIRHL